LAASEHPCAAGATWKSYTSGTKQMFIASCAGLVNDGHHHALVRFSRSSSQRQERQDCSQGYPASGTLSSMLFMVIEHFKQDGLKAVGERFQARGRMMPNDVTYHSSWMDEVGSRCFQIMEAPDRSALAGWTRNWDDLVDFEVVPILTSADFWSRRTA